MWAPDGKRIAYVRDGDVYVQSADGAGDGEPLVERPGNQEPYSWTADGETVLFSERRAGAKFDIWAVSLRDRVATPVLVTPDNERLPAVSPDGKWLAYISDESGRYEVYVRPFRGSGAQVPASVDGGTEPVWSRDGRELFFRRGNEYYSAAVKPAGTFEVDPPQFLFTHGLPFASSEVASYDVTPDAQHFVMIASAPESAPTHFRLVTNWVQELVSRVPSSSPK